MDENKKRKSRFFPGFLLGLIVGVLGAALAPSWWQSYVPDALFPQETVTGLVLQKDREAKRLLVKVETSEGVLLATFTERQEAIDLLIEPGDSVTLRVSRYEPFLTDPRLDRVRKPERTERPPVAPSGSSEPSTPSTPESTSSTTPSTTTTTAAPTTTTPPPSSNAPFGARP